MIGPYHARNAWWGFVTSRTRPALGVVHGVVIRDASSGGRELLLAVRHDLRGWELPGGHFEGGEVPEDALRREVLEETGFLVEVGELTGVYHRTGFLPHTASVHLCKVRGGMLAPSAETPRVRWWPADQLPGTLFPWLRLPVADALAHEPGAPPVVRTDRQGLLRILQAAWIDLSMRLSDDESP
jgi:8-oxo-dGTP diphosphatase